MRRGSHPIQSPRHEQAQRGEPCEHQAALACRGYQCPTDERHEYDDGPERHQAPLLPASDIPALLPVGAPDCQGHASQSQKAERTEQSIDPTGRGDVHPAEQPPIGHDKAFPLSQELTQRGHRVARTLDGDECGKAQRVMVKSPVAKVPPTREEQNGQAYRQTAGHESAPGFVTQRHAKNRQRCQRQKAQGAGFGESPHA